MPRSLEQAGLPGEQLLLKLSSKQVCNAYCRSLHIPDFSP